MSEGEKIYNKFFEKTLDKTEKQCIREYYDETYEIEVTSVIDLLKEATIEKKQPQPHQGATPAFLFYYTLIFSDINLETFSKYSLNDKFL